MERSPQIPRGERTLPDLDLQIAVLAAFRARRAARVNEYQRRVGATSVESQMAVATSENVVQPIQDGLINHD